MQRYYHHLKCETEYFQATERGEKKFEIRINDRNFKPHDIVYLHETVNGTETGRIIGSLEIMYVFKGPKYGIQDDYCVFNW